MGKGWRISAWVPAGCFARIAALALMLVLAAAPALASVAPKGDAITVGKPANHESVVKETELAQSDDAEEGDAGAAQPPPPAQPPAGAGQAGLPGAQPKDVLPGGGVAPTLPAGKEGQPGAEQPASGGRKAPDFPISENYLHFKSADSVTYDKNKMLLVLTGDVVIEVNETTLSADYVEVDENSKQIYAKGHIAVWQKDDIIFGDELFLNYETKYFRVTNPSGNSSSQDVNGHVYFEGRNLEGTFDRYVITKGRVTTCEPFCGPNEYHISSRKVIVKPQKQVIMEENYGYVNDHKVFYWPLLIIPLKRDRNRQNRGPLDQSYGYNDTEGWFAKYAWTYRVQYNNDLQYPLLSVAIAEFMQKKGINIGHKQDYYIDNFGSGTFTWEYLFSNESIKSGQAAAQMNSLAWDNSLSAFEPYRTPDQTTGATGGKTPKDYYIQLSQDFYFSRHTSGKFSISRTDKYSLYRSRTNAFQSSFSISNTSPKSTTSITFNQGWTGSATQGAQESKSINTTAGFTNKYSFSRDFTWNLSQSYSSNKRTNGGAANQEGAFQNDFTYSRPKYNLGLRWHEDIDFDDTKYLGDRNAIVNHETPRIDLTLRKKLWEANMTNVSDINISLVNSQNGPRNNLNSIFWGSMKTDWSKRFQFDRYQSLSTRLGFEQYMYDDGNAIYVYSPNVTYDYSPQRHMDFHLTWSQLQPEGRASPSTRQRYSSSNTFSSGLDLTNNRTWKATFSTSYDYKLSKWRPIVALLNWDPNDNFGLTFETGWDIEKRDFRQDGRLDTSYFADSGNWNLFTRTFFVASKPATGNHLHGEGVLGWDRTTVTFNRKFIRNWDLQVLAEQSRKDNTQLIRRLALTKVNCCTTMQFGYDYNNKQYYMQVFINAFPNKTSTLKYQDNTFYLDTPANDLFNPGTYTGSGLGSFY